MGKNKWKATGRGNQVLSTNGLLVSYNPDTADGRSFLTKIMNFLGENVCGGEETALRMNGVWYILTGDFRKEYEKAFPDAEKCLAVYKKNIKYRNNWSTDNP